MKFFYYLRNIYLMRVLIVELNVRIFFLFMLFIAMLLYMLNYRIRGVNEVVRGLLINILVFLYLV